MSRKHDRTGRSKGEGRFVRIFQYMMKSPAWQHLGPLEVAIYLEMSSRYAGENSNNGRIGYSVREAATRFRVGKTTVSRALQELQEKGFIVCTTKGGFSVKIRRATEWRLTEFRCDVTQQMATKDFLQWQPSVPVAGQKMQNTVLVEGRGVPGAGQRGTWAGTMESKRGPDGTGGGTVEYQNGPLTVPVPGHMYICQVEAEEREALEPTTKHGNIALRGSAVKGTKEEKIEPPPVTASSPPPPMNSTNNQGTPRNAPNPAGSNTSPLLATTYMRRALLKGVK